MANNSIPVFIPVIVLYTRDATADQIIGTDHSVATYNNLETDHRLEIDHSVPTYQNVEIDHNLEIDHSVTSYQNVENDHNLEIDHSVTSYQNVENDHNLEIDHSVTTYQNVENDHNLEIDHSATTYQNVENDHNLEIDHSATTYQNVENDHNLEIDHSVTTYQNVENDHNLEIDHSVTTYQNVENDHNLEIDHSVATYQNVENDHNLESDHRVTTYQNVETDHNLESDHSVTTYQIVENDDNLEIDHSVVIYQNVENDHNLEINHSVTTYQNLEPDHNLEIDHSVTTYQNLEPDHNLGIDHSVTTYQNLETDHNLEIDHSVATYQNAETDHNLEIDHGVATYHNLNTYHNLETDPNLEFDHSVAIYQNFETDPNLKIDHSVATYHDLEADHSVATYHTLETYHNSQTDNSLETAIEMEEQGNACNNETENEFNIVSTLDEASTSRTVVTFDMSTQTESLYSPDSPEEYSSDCEPVTKKVKHLMSLDCLIDNMVSSTEKLRVVLGDDIFKPITFTRLYVAQVKDVTHLSNIILTLNKKFPLKDLSHLKRAYRKEVILFPAAYLKIQTYEMLIKFIQENISELKDEFEYFKIADLPSFAPRTKQQYIDCGRNWSCNFHHDKQLESLCSGDIFPPVLIKRYRLYMGMAFEVAKYYLSQTKTNLEASDVQSADFNAAVVFDPFNDSIVAVAFDNRLNHPLQHSAMLAIDNVARTQMGGAWETPTDIFEPNLQGMAAMDLVLHLKNKYPDVKFGAKPYLSKSELAKKKSKASSSPYLCTGYYIYLIREPCLMCSMALVHARCKRVFFAVPHSTGAVSSMTKLQSIPALNHHFEVFTDFL